MRRPDFIRLVAKRIDVPESTAEAIWELYVRERIIRKRRHSYTLELVHGAFLDVDVLRRAADAVGEKSPTEA